MVDEPLCPDCGGVVGASLTTEAGPPCRCFTASTKTVSAKSLGAGEATESVAIPAPQAEKVCVICGKDLNGHRRIRQTRGYLCIACAKEEEARDANGRVRCRVCGRMVKEQVMENYEGTRMCPQCNREREQKQKEKIKRIGITTAHVRHEKRTLYTLAGIGGVLLLIILLSWLHLLPRIF